MNEGEKFLPCGHSEEQAQWLKCTETKCRPDDEWLSEQYRAWVKAGRPGSAQQTQEKVPTGWRRP
ncbi:MAG TPA: hypothetical protein VFT36_00400 [Methylomirabilota bacterium]|nr:hypothetical protein [Methylomirabilota bacterium]